MVKPGNPPYLKYVRSSVDEKRKQYQTETGADPIALPDQSKRVYKTTEGDQVLEGDVHGNPNLVYHSKFVEGWEPSGVPVWSLVVSIECLTRLLTRRRMLWRSPAVLAWRDLPSREACLTR